MWCFHSLRLLGKMKENDYRECDQKWPSFSIPRCMSWGEDGGLSGRVLPCSHVPWLVSHPVQLSPNVTIVTIPSKVAAWKLNVASPVRVLNVSAFHWCKCSQYCGTECVCSSVVYCLQWSMPNSLEAATYVATQNLLKRSLLGGASTCKTVMYIRHL